MSIGLPSPKTSEGALNQGSLSTISTETSRITGCPICSSLVGENTAANHSLNWNNSEKKCIVCGKNCGKPALLDLFSGAGGAARGYQQAGFCVLGIDIKPQPHYAGCRFHQADALAFPTEGFSAIHASPPCQAHTCLKTMWNAKKHEDLIPETRARLKASGLPYVIENVPGAPLLAGWHSIILCGTMFGLRTKDGSGELRRHRLFECNFYPGLTPPCKHSGPVIGVYGGHGRDRRRTVTVTGHCGGYSRRDGLQSFPVKQQQEAMGIDWMTGGELSQAIPPAYMEFIGRQLIKYLERAVTRPPKPGRKRRGEIENNRD